jgi:hypothetical protein
MNRLLEWTEHRPFALADPYGLLEACSLEAGEAAAERGIEFAFTIEPAGHPDLKVHLHLGRFDCNDVPGGRLARFDATDFFHSVEAAACHR